MEKERGKKRGQKKSEMNEWRSDESNKETLILFLPI